MGFGSSSPSTMPPPVRGMTRSSIGPVAAAFAWTAKLKTFVEWSGADDAGDGVARHVLDGGPRVEHAVEPADLELARLLLDAHLLGHLPAAFVVVIKSADPL